MLITGATGGIGRALVQQFVEAGATVTATARDRSRLSELATQAGVRTVSADLTEPSSITQLLATVSDVDVLVCNAAVHGSGRLEHMSADEISSILESNLVAPLILTSSLLPRMLEARRGHIVFVGSVGGLTGFPGSTLYSSSKFGLRGAAQSLRHDLADSGVGVSLVMPGFVRGAGMLEDTLGSRSRRVPTSTPEDVAAAVLRAVELDTDEVVVGPGTMRAAAALARSAPRIGRRLAARAVRRLNA